MSFSQVQCKKKKDKNTWDDNTIAKLVNGKKKENSTLSIEKYKLNEKSKKRLLLKVLQLLLFSS